MTLQIGLLLVGNHFSHQFHSRIIFTTITGTLLRLDRYLAECAIVSGQTNRDMARRLRTHIDHLLTIAHRTDGESPTVVSLNTETALAIGNCRYPVTLILDGSIRHRTSIRFVDYHAGDLSQRQQRYHQQKRKEDLSHRLRTRL